MPNKSQILKVNKINHDDYFFSNIFKTKTKVKKIVTKKHKPNKKSIADFNSPRYSNSNVIKKTDIKSIKEFKQIRTRLEQIE